MTAVLPALVRRAFFDARTRTLAFAYVYAVYSWVETVGFKSAFPTAADRAAFARVFAGNDAIRLFYGFPFDVATVGGYGAWRVGGTLALAAAAFGVLAAVRAMRTEEDAGRAEVVLAGVVSRRAVFGASMAAVTLGTALLWAAELVGLVVAGLPLAGSAYLALATASIVPVFVGIGALASQVAPTRTVALASGLGIVALCWLLRVLGDTVGGAAWVRWTTPLGWAEELRPFAGARPLVLVLPVAATAVLVATARRLSLGRDLGSGLLAGRDARRPRRRPLSSPAALALQRERGVLGAWVVGVAAVAVVFGAIAPSMSGAGIPGTLRRDFDKFGAGSLVSPTGYLSFVVIVFIFAVCLFVVSQAAAARQEEAGLRLETLLAQPVSRSRWLGGRMVVAVVAVAVLSRTAGLMLWAGATSQGVAVSLPRLLEAGANCLPVAVLVLGTAALCYAAVPRASTPLSYALVTVAFLWYLVGSVFSLPAWVVGLTPFHHIGLVPAQQFRAEAAAVMAGVGVAAAAAALGVFRRRDLLEG